MHYTIYKHTAQLADKVCRTPIKTISLISSHVGNAIGACDPDNH